MAGNTFSRNQNSGNKSNGGNQSNGGNRSNGNNRSYGNQRKQRQPRPSRAEQPEPRLWLLVPGGVIAIDCEGVILGDSTGADSNGVGRVSITNENGDVIYDTFVFYPRERLARPPPQRLNLGVTYNDIKPEYGAQPHRKVLNDVQSILDRAGVIVGHEIKNERKMMPELTWNRSKERDTQDAAAYRGYNLYGKPKLSVLAREVLGETIQSTEHNSVEDARATMKLYLRERASIDQAQGPVAPAAAAPAAVVMAPVVVAPAPVIAPAVPAPVVPSTTALPAVAAGAPTAKKTWAMVAS